MCAESVATVIPGTPAFIRQRGDAVRDDQPRDPAGGVKKLGSKLVLFDIFGNRDI